MIIKKRQDQNYSIRQRRMTRLLCFGTAFWCSAASILGAIATNAEEKVVVLQNGDQLTGGIIAQTPEHVIVAHPFLGEISLATEAVVSINGIPVPSKATQETHPAPSEGPITSDASPPISQPVEPDPPAAAVPTDAISEIPGLTQIWSAMVEAGSFMDHWYPFSSWNNRIDFSYGFESGEIERTDLHIRFTAETKIEGREFLIFAQRRDRRTEQDNGSIQRNPDLYEGRFRMRLPWRDQLFAQSDSDYRQDRRRSVAHDFRSTVGVGFDILERDALSLAITPSLGVEYFETFSQNGDGDTSLIATLSQDFSLQINERLGLAQEARLSSNLSDAGNLDFDFHVELEQRLNRVLSVVFRYEFGFDRETDAGIEATQHEFSIAVGARF